MEKMSHEIRILAGIHAGAKMTASGSITIGSAPECDIVLSDPGMLPEAAVVTIDKSTWSIKLTDKAFPVTLSPGDVFWLGVVPISVALSSQIWPQEIPSPEQTKQYQASPSPNEDEDDDDDYDNIEDTVLSGSAAGDTANDVIKISSTTETVVNKKNRSKALVMLIVFLTVVLCLIGSHFVLSNSKRVSSYQKAMSKLEKLEASVKIILAYEFSRFNIHIERSDSQKIVIKGYVPDRSDVHKIERKLSSLSRQVLLRVFVVSEIAESVQEILKDKFPNIHLKNVSLKGVVSLSGFGSNSEIAGVGTTVETSVTGVSSVDYGDIKSGSDISSELKKEAIRSGLGSLSFQYYNNTIQVRGSLNSSSMHVWDQLLSEFGKKYKSLVSVSANIVETPDNQTSNQKEAHTDKEKYANAVYKSTKDYGAYGIYGVVNGANKYIITEGGKRVMVGGNIGNFRLAEINDNEIVLDGPQKLVLRR